MKIKLKDTKEQRALVELAGSKNKIQSAEAMEALAAFISGVAQKVLKVAGSANRIYTDNTFNEDDSPSIPLDLFYNEKIGHITIWSQSQAGGLPSSLITGSDEFKVMTYRLDSAISIYKKYARKARLDVVSKAISKMLEEVLVKQERNAWAVILRALAEANTNGLEHVIDASADNVFQVEDLNKLITRLRRVNATIDGFTPSNFDSKGVTDLFCSPEILEQIRAFAYQPMNTRQATSGTTSIPLPDNIRENIFNAAGAQEIYGVGINELLELGDNGIYNRVFDEYYGGAVNMAHGTDQIVIGLDLSRESFVRMLAQNADSGSTFDVTPDDQYVTRQDKMGWYGSLEEGRVCLDSRAICGIVV